MRIDGQEVDHIIELRGVYDGWSVAVLADGTPVNRWSTRDVDGDIIPFPGQETRFHITEAFLAGEPANGRWF